MATQAPEQISVKVQESLAETPYACTSLSALSGGTTNFLYRGILKSPLPDGSKTVIVKHTEGYVASSPAFKITETRCEFEKIILASLSTLPHTIHDNITITTPHLYQFLPSPSHTLIAQDLPFSVDLKTYLLSHPLSQPLSLSLGKSLGLWARSFHTWAQAPLQEKLKEDMRGNESMRQLKYFINYGRLVDAIKSWEDVLGGSRELFEEVRDAAKRDLEEKKGEQVIHGDFWSGNVLLPNAPISSTSTPLQLFIVDWELSNLSYPFYDLGQMFAELYCLTHFKSIEAGIWIIQGFMEGYGKLEDEAMKWKVLVQVGVHFLVFSSRIQGWGTQEQVVDVVRKGRELIEKGWRREREGLEEVWNSLFN